MSKTLTIVDDATARRIHKTAPPELQEILENSYGKAFFSTNIMEIVISFETACEYNNTDPNARRFTVGTRNQIYQERVAEIIKALNQGWVPNYNNSCEYKWSPYFYLNSPGFRFFGSYYVLSATNSAGGSRLALKNRELSDYAGNQFTREYEMWLTPVQENDTMASIASGSFNAKPFTRTIKEWEDYIMPLVNSFESACKFRNVDPYAERFCSGTPDEIAYKKGKLVCDVLNGPFIGQMKDTSSRKWYAWMEKTESGFRFNDSGCVFTLTYSSGGSRLRLCSEKLAKHFAVGCCEMMAPYWWNE